MIVNIFKKNHPQTNKFFLFQNDKIYNTLSYLYNIYTCILLYCICVILFLFKYILQIHSRFGLLKHLCHPSSHRFRIGQKRRQRVSTDACAMLLLLLMLSGIARVLLNLHFTRCYLVYQRFDGAFVLPGQDI